MLSVKYPHQANIFAFVQPVAANASHEAPEHHLVSNADHTDPGKSINQSGDLDILWQTSFGFNCLLLD